MTSKTNYFLGGLMAALLGLARTSRADVIVQFGAGSTGSGFAAGVGQSITTPAGGSWKDITFNFYDSATGAPQAEGSVYLFSAPYTGTPQGLSLSSPGLLDIGIDSGSIYNFSPALTLAPGTQYYIYCDTRPGGPGGTAILGNDYTGGTFFRSPNGDGNFLATGSSDVAFSLEGTLVVAPEPSVTALMVMGVLGLLIFGRRRALTRMTVGR